MSVIYFMITYVKSEFSAEQCQKLGFNSVVLKCSSCDLLGKYELSPLKDGCYGCCQNLDGSFGAASTDGSDGNDTDGESKPKRYPQARLEVCGWKLGSFPQVQAFVKSDKPGKFPNLQVKYVGGQMPQIKLIDAEGVAQETLSITKWDTDTIEEFLQTYLEN